MADPNRSRPQLRSSSQKSKVSGKYHPSVQADNCNGSFQQEFDSEKNKPSTFEVDFPTSSISNKKISCSKCNKLVSDLDDSLNCVVCSRSFHLHCTLFNHEVFALMKEKDSFEDIFWRCSFCKDISPKERLSMSTLLQQMNNMQYRLAVLENKSKKSDDNSRIKSNKMTMGNPITHQVIVANHNNESFSRDTFANRVKSNLQTVPINNIKVSKDGMGVINFPNQTARDNGLEKLKKDFKVHANNRPYRNLTPKISIYDIDSNDYNEKDSSKLKDAITEKNPVLKELIQSGNTFDILFIRKDIRRNGSSVAVVKVDPEIYKAIKSLNFQIFIDFKRCHVSDRFHVTQCYRCQKFGHMKDNCTMKGDAQICRYCTNNHDGKSCPHKGNYTMYKCANCGNNHSSSYTGCTILRNQVEHLANRTMGLEDFSKNEIRPHVITT